MGTEIPEGFYTQRHYRDYLRRDCPPDGLSCGACPIGGCDNGALRSPFERPTVSRGYPLDKEEKASLDESLSRDSRAESLGIRRQAAIRWEQQPDADPLGDLRALADKIAAEAGSYKPLTWIMSSRQKEAYERWTVWYEETKKRLDALPRRRYLARRVLERQLYGHPMKTSIFRAILARRAVSLYVWKLRRKIVG